MAASNTVIESGIKSDGVAFERGTFTSSGGTTTHNITAGAGTSFPTSGIAKIGTIRFFAVSSDSDDVIKTAQDVGDNVLKLTFTANDTGKYYIEGPSVG